MPLERGRRIDYILVRSGPHGPVLDIADCRRVLTDPIDGVQPSDHYGLLADLRRPDHPPGVWADV
jgi:endonuclease/exonuclease/phosphatase family metal-dependent hydrolase